MVGALVGWNTCLFAACGNYLLHRSAVGNHYLHPGCQPIGFPFHRRSDIRWFFCGVCTRKCTVRARACVSVCAALTVIYACCHLACTTSKGQECHLVPRGYLLKVIGYVTSGTRSQRILAGDDRSATPPEQLRPLSSVKKLIKSKFMSLQTLTAQFPFSVKMSALVKQIIKRLCCVCFFF